MVCSLLKTSNEDENGEQGSEDQSNPDVENSEQGGQKLYVATGPRCLPQGSPASPALTNVACDSIDGWPSMLSITGGALLDMQMI